MGEGKSSVGPYRGLFGGAAHMPALFYAGTYRMPWVGAEGVLEPERARGSRGGHVVARLGYLVAKATCLHFDA